MDANEVTLKVNGPLLVDGVDLIRQARPVRVWFDMAEVPWLRTLDLARIRCAIDLALKLDIEVAIKYPRRESVRNYAGRMGLFEGTGYEYPFKKQDSDSFFPLQRIVSDQNEGLFDLCERVLGEKIPANYVRRVSDAFCELADNVYFHSGAEVNTGWGYVVAQTVGTTVGIAIADFGVGFYGSYSRQGTLRGRTEQEVLQDAFNEGESSLNPAYRVGHRGIGLAEVIRFVYGTGQGMLSVRSGETNAMATGGTLAVAKSPYKIPGSWVHMEVPLP